MINSQKFATGFLVLAFLAAGVFIKEAAASSGNADILASAEPAVNQPETARSFAVSPGRAESLSLGSLTVRLASTTVLAASQLALSQIASSTDPWQLKRLSPVYQVDLPAAAYDYKDPFWVEIKFKRNGNNLVQIFFYDGTKDTWRPLPTSEIGSRQSLQAKLPFPYARLAIFEQPEILSVGQASWYKYKGGLFAASPDFPKGSRLRVFNLDAPGRFVDVTVNDFGPDRDRHPDRVIDLDKVAFKRIAPTGQGMARVRVEPLLVAKPSGQWLGQPAEGYAATLRLKTKAAAVVDPKTGQLLFAKDASSSRPIASLTKLVAAFVFLENKPSFDRVVPYSVKDEEYNYRYAKKWEVARLKVADGETMTIEDLFYSALVGSANNAVESLVRVSGLERDRFIDRMNQLVREWGASGTRFVEPTGLSPENVSSAADYAIISSKALAHPIIEKASKVKSYQFVTVNKKTKHTIRNTNQLITYGRLKVSGSKTGYLDEAGYCLLTRAEGSSGRSVIVVTLGSPDRAASFGETEALARYGLSLMR